MTLPEHCDDLPASTPRDHQGQGSSHLTSMPNVGGGLSASMAATPRDMRAPGYRNRSVMSDVLPSDSRLSFLPIIRRSSMASSVASSIKSSSLYSSSTGSNSPMSGPPTGFSSPAKMIHLPKLLLREMQPGYFDVQDEMVFNRSMRLPELDKSPTDCRLNLVAQKLQEGSNSSEIYEQEEVTAQAHPSHSEFREIRGSRDTEREAPPKRKRRKNRKRSEQRQKNVEAERNED